jgi:hypothetical protein
MAFRRSQVRSLYPPLHKALRDNELREAFLMHRKKGKNVMLRTCYGKHNFGHPAKKPRGPVGALFSGVESRSHPLPDRLSPADHE